MYDHIIMQLQLAHDALDSVHSHDDYAFDEETCTIEEYERQKRVEDALESMKSALEDLRGAK